jgi:hypothetical protein
MLFEVKLLRAFFALFVSVPKALMNEVKKGCGTRIRT